MTSVSSSSPRCLRSLTSAADGLVGVAALDLELRGQVAVLVPAGVQAAARSARRARPAAGPSGSCRRTSPAASRPGRTCRARAAARSRSRSAPARSPASGRPSRTARCAWRSPGRRTPRSFSSLSLREVVEQAAAHLAAHAVGVRQVQHRVAAAAELHALELASAGSRCPSRSRRRSARSDASLSREVMTTNAGQVLGLAAQAVGQPRAHARPARQLRRRSGRT